MERLQLLAAHVADASRPSAPAVVLVANRGDLSAYYSSSMRCEWNSRWAGLQTPTDRSRRVVNGFIMLVGFFTKRWQSGYRILVFKVYRTRSSGKGPCTQWMRLSGYRLKTPWFDSCLFSWSGCWYDFLFYFSAKVPVWVPRVVLWGSRLRIQMLYMNKTYNNYN